MIKTGFNTEHWKTLLPETYDWSAKVKLDTVNEIVTGAAHIVALAQTKEGDESVTLNSPSLTADVQMKITAALNISGWKGSGSHVTVVDGTPFILIAPTKVKTTKPQISRALGLSAAAALKNLKTTRVVLCKAEGICTKSVFDGIAQGFYAQGAFKGNKKDTERSNCNRP